MVPPLLVSVAARAATNAALRRFAVGEVARNRLSDFVGGATSSLVQQYQEMKRREAGDRGDELYR